MALLGQKKNYRVYIAKWTFRGMKEDIIYSHPVLTVLLQVAWQTSRQQSCHERTTASRLTGGSRPTLLPTLHTRPGMLPLTARQIASITVYTPGQGQWPWVEGDTEAGKRETVRERDCWVYEWCRLLYGIYPLTVVKLNGICRVQTLVSTMYALKILLEYKWREYRKNTEFNWEEI